MNRSTRLIAIVVVLALVGGGAAVTLVAALTGAGGMGGSSSFTPAPTTRPQPGATTAPAPALERFYNQTIDWGDCTGDGPAECAALTVPVDYRDPSGPVIKLNLLRIPASDPSERIGSLVVNPGGPGAPGTQYAAQAEQVFRKPLLQHFDIVGFDPRGTGDSDPVECLTPSQLDTFLATDPDPDTPAESQELTDGLAAFYRGCVQRSDQLIGHVTTVETARDMDVLRAALGETRLTYFGASYGTKLGATYADLFPKNVGRFVLDGAVDVSLDFRQLALGQARGFETALRAYVADCVQSASCPLGDDVEGGLAKITDLVDSTDSKPLPTGQQDRPLTEALAFYGLVTPLYNRDYWPYLTQALGAAFKGDGSVLLALADAYASRLPDGTYADNSAQAIYAINCLDDPSSISPAQVPAELPAFEKASPTFGKVFAWGLVGCRGIQVKATETDDSITAAGAPPIVVIGTTRDPATPYAWAVALAKQLKSGVLITRDGDGHTGYNSGNQCVDEAVEAYLVDDTVPEDGLRC